MPLHLVVLAKQVTDAEAPAAAYGIDRARMRVTLQGTPMVLNGFDENAVEAALRIKDKRPDTRITVISAGAEFALDVIKKPLAMGADALVLLQDPAFTNGVDPTLTVAAIAAAIRKLGGVDLVIAGRQASDWDNAQVPLGVAESLGWPVVSIARTVSVDAAAGGEGMLARAERILPDGHELVEVSLPAVVTVSNELGTPRYPTMRGIMASKRITATVWTAADLGMDTSDVTPALRVVDLALPDRRLQTEFITADTPADAGRRLALRLRESRLI